MSELAAGKPDYGQMSSAFAGETRQELGQLQNFAVQLGAVKSVTFHGVRSDGADLYRVACENGGGEWSVLLSADGKIDDAIFGLGLE
jgi:hypothetical protein